MVPLDSDFSSGLTFADFHFSEKTPFFMERFAILVSAGMIVGSTS